jgi:hypothetical protein
MPWRMRIWKVGMRKTVMTSLHMSLSLNGMTWFTPACLLLANPITPLTPHQRPVLPEHSAGSMQDTLPESTKTRQRGAHPAMARLFSEGERPESVRRGADPNLAAEALACSPSRRGDIKPCCNTPQGQGRIFPPSIEVTVRPHSSGMARQVQ